MPTRTVAANRHALALALYESGLDTRAIAAELGIDRCTVYNSLRRARQQREQGQTFPPEIPGMGKPVDAANRPEAFYRRSETRERYEAAKRLRAQGYSYHEIARVCGWRSHTTAMVACKGASGTPGDSGCVHKHD